MMGKNHLKISVPALAASSTAVYSLSKCDGVIGEFGMRVLRAFVPSGNIIRTGLYVLVGLALYALGSLLPDIDSKKSMLGRYIYLPVKHRRITHTIWVVIVLGVLSWRLPVFWWLTWGYFLHIAWDWFSAGGIAWTWPIGRYIEYANGVSVKKGFRLKLYRTEGVSETIFLVGASIVLLIFSGMFLLQGLGIWK